MGLKLELSRVYKSYNDQAVLQDCSFSFADGGTYTLMGHNGSGKSTLLRICALLEKPDQGEVRFLAGERLLHPGLDLKRRITLVFPRVGIFNTSVFKNVAYGLKIRRLGQGELEAKVRQILEMVGLKKKAYQRALTLSSGETMRLGLARALVIDPEILLLDEPTTSIDRRNTEIIEECLLNLKKTRHMTIFLVTHSRTQAENLADRLLFLNDGRIISP